MRFLKIQTVVSAVAALALTTRVATAQTVPMPTVPSPSVPVAGARLSPNLAASGNSPTIPGWVRAGLGVTYVAYSAFVENGRYVDPIELTVTSHVATASRAAVWGTTKTQVVNEPLSSNYAWTCTSLGVCRGGDWQFWVDPNDPTDSIRGPEGERFAIVGSGKYTDPWKRVWNATLLNYQNASGDVRFTVAYDRSTGLVLYNVESYSTEYVIEYYYS